MAKSNGKSAAKANGKAPKASETAAADTAGTVDAGKHPPQMSAEAAEKIVKLRSSVRENFGKVAMAMMFLPRYRSQTLGDLQHLILEPMLRDRLAIAYPPADKDNPLRDMSGAAIWASVSEDVDERIREQIAAGSWPVRLKAEDWTSGEINWLLDVIAPTEEAILAVITNFRQVVKEGQLRLHPMVTRMVNKETLEKLGASKLSDQPAAETQPEAEQQPD